MSVLEVSQETENQSEKRIKAGTRINEEVSSFALLFLKERIYGVWLRQSF